ncbi:hypothetical protein ACJX0J_040124, partial [Zea mays]
MHASCLAISNDSMDILATLGVSFLQLRISLAHMRSNLKNNGPGILDYFPIATSTCTSIYPTAVGLIRVRRNCYRVQDHPAKQVAVYKVVCRSSKILPRKELYREGHVSISDCILDILLFVFCQNFIIISLTLGID